MNTVKFLFLVEPVYEVEAPIYGSNYYLKFLIRMKPQKLFIFSLYYDNMLQIIKINTSVLTQHVFFRAR